MSWGFNTAAKPAGTGFGAPAASAPASSSGFGVASGAGTTGFGAASGGFGAAARPATGFGAAPAASGGFGAAPTTAPTAGGGFGTGFGGGFGAAAKPAGGGFGGFGGGGGGFGTSAAQPQQPAMPTAQQYPYKGVKGPGNTTSWSQTVDFSQINDSTSFESLPPPLQQHLLELRTFMHTERASMRAVTSYMNDTDAGSGTYRGLTRLLTQLKSGRNATEALGVRCSHRDREAESFGKSLDVFEAEIRQYQRDIWEPMAGEGDSGARLGGASRLGNTSGVQGRRNAQLTQQPFVALVSQLHEQMDRQERQLRELAFDLVPSASEGTYGSTVNTDSLLAANHSLLSGSRLQTNGMTTGVRSLGGDRGTTGSATAVGDVAAQINVTLANELSVLMNLSLWAANLHARSDIARDLFARSFGQAEADILFAATRAATGNYTLPVRGDTMGGGGGQHTIPFELPRLPTQAPTAPTAIGVTGTTGFGASAATAPTTGFGAPTAGGFGARPAGAGLGGIGTVGGFGTAAAPGIGGFGAKAPATAAPATASFGAAAVPATTAAATTTTTTGAGFGFGASAPAAAPGSAPAATTGATATTTTGAGFGFGASAPAAAPGSAPAATTGATTTGAGFGFGASAPAAAPGSTPAAGAGGGGFNMSASSPRFGPKRTANADDDSRPETRMRP